MTYDLKRIEENFHKLLKSDCEGFYRLEDLRVTEELFKKGELVHVPFGFMKYRLITENGEAVLEVRTVSRMDVDEICFIYEDEIRRCDLFDVYGDERRRKIESVRRNPPGCDVCRDLDEPGIHACPKCGRNVLDIRFRKHLREMQEKYGSDDLLELSREKLSFSQIITIYTFIERCDRHCADTPTADRCRRDGTFANLEKRMDEIAREVM